MEYIQSRYVNNTWLPFRLITTAFEEKWERSLVFFVQLRQLHRKPIIYDFSYRKVSIALNCSMGTVKKHILSLIDKKMLSINNGNLILTGTNKLSSQYGGFLAPVNCSPDKKTQLTYLRYVLIKRNLRLQEKAHQKALDIIYYHKGLLKGLTGKQVKGILKAEETIKAKTGFAVEKGLRGDFLLSNIKIGNICNRGIFTGLKIQKDFNQLGLIESVSNYRFVKSPKLTRKQFFAMQEATGKFTSPNYSLSEKGNIYKRLPNKILIKL